MTSQPEQPFGGMQYPSFQDSASPGDPNAPIDYPASCPPLPPPVYPQPVPGYPAGYPAYPAGYPLPYGGYPVDPYDPYRTLKPAGTNGKAIGALVASLAGLLFCGLPSIAGLVLGIVAMRETRRSGQDGYPIALAGTIIGGIVAVIWLVFILMWLLGMMIALNSPVIS